MMQKQSVPDFGFILAFDLGYSRMATALVNAIAHFHPGKPIRVLTKPSDFLGLQTWAASRPHIEILSYPDPGLDFGEWHPLVWAKLEAFASEDHAFEVVLDVDQILYGPLSEYIAAAAASGKMISASPDITDLRGHVRESYGSVERRAMLSGVPCFNAGAMIVRPSRDAYKELVDLAREVHRDLRLPEQAVLNLWARLRNQHHDLGEGFMLHPLSPKLLEPRVPSCLVHFWTPRPPFFGTSPIRSSEPTWGDCMALFEREHGRPYPVERFERDFLEWLGKQPDKEGP